MEQEKFQELVLEQLGALKQDVGNLQQNMEGLQQSMDAQFRSVRSDIKTLDRKVDQLIDDLSHVLPTITDVTGEVIEAKFRKLD